MPRVITGARVEHAVTESTSVTGIMSKFARRCEENIAVAAPPYAAHQRLVTAVMSGTCTLGIALVLASTLCAQEVGAQRADTIHTDSLRRLAPAIVKLKFQRRC